MFEIRGYMAYYRYFYLNPGFECFNQGITVSNEGKLLDTIKCWVKAFVKKVRELISRFVQFVRRLVKCFVSLFKRTLSVFELIDQKSVDIICKLISDRPNDFKPYNVCLTKEGRLPDLVSVLKQVETILQFIKSNKPLDQFNNNFQFELVGNIYIVKKDNELISANESTSYTRANILLKDMEVYLNEGRSINERVNKLIEDIGKEIEKLGKKVDKVDVDSACEQIKLRLQCYDKLRTILTEVARCHFNGVRLIDIILDKSLNWG